MVSPRWRQLDSLARETAINRSKLNAQNLLKLKKSNMLIIGGDGPAGTIYILCIMKPYSERSIRSHLYDKCYFG